MPGTPSRRAALSGLSASGGLETELNLQHLHTQTLQQKEKAKQFSQKCYKMLQQFVVLLSEPYVNLAGILYDEPT